MCAFPTWSQRIPLKDVRRIETDAAYPITVTSIPFVDAESSEEPYAEITCDPDVCPHILVEVMEKDIVYVGYAEDDTPALVDAAVSIKLPQSSLMSISLQGPGLAILNTLVDVASRMEIFMGALTSILFPIPCRRERSSTRNV